MFMNEKKGNNSNISKEIGKKSEEVVKLEARIADLERKNTELKEFAFNDPLTGAYNRRFGDEILEKECSGKARNDLSIAYIDIDGFKVLNDLWSHDQGDEVLKKITTGLEETVRETDTVVRWGGDEFLIILPSSGENQQDYIKERIKKVGLDNKFRLSVGVATLKTDERKNVKEFVEEAENKMKEDKPKEDSREKLAK
jgi:diguanylate cyclase (GGDEF)-like protein